MENEIIKRLWRIVYSNSHEEPFTAHDGVKDFRDSLWVQEENCEWDAIRIFWRLYWITSLTKMRGKKNRATLTD